jgi:hypothetical protein
LKQVCKTWEKSETQKLYFDSKFERLISVKAERDKITHPESSSDFQAISIDDLKKVKSVFHEYDEFITKLMNGFFLGMKNYPFV